MKEIVNLLKELLLLKPETQSAVGLSGLKKQRSNVLIRPKKKVKKEIRISELMRRA